MQVLFSSQHIYIIDYPSYGAIELFDRRSGTVGLMVGSAADRFRHELDDLITGNPEPDSFEDLIDGYGEVMMQSVVRH